MRPDDKGYSARSSDKVYPPILNRSQEFSTSTNRLKKLLSMFIMISETYFTGKSSALVAQNQREQLDFAPSPLSDKQLYKCKFSLRFKFDVHKEQNEKGANGALPRAFKPHFCDYSFSRIYMQKETTKDVFNSCCFTIAKGSYDGSHRQAKST